MTNKYDDLFDEADEAFDKKYGKELKQLQALTDEEIESITPGAEGKEEYDKLIKAVQEASQQNISQAQLAQNIRDLGDVVVKIVYKIPQLAKIL